MTDDLWWMSVDDMPLPLLHGPGAERWPTGTVAWCQSCDRPIREGVATAYPIPHITRAGGLVHSSCPPILGTVRSLGPVDQSAPTTGHLGLIRGGAR